MLFSWHVAFVGYGLTRLAALFLGGLATRFEVRTNSVAGSRRIARGVPWAGSNTGGAAWGIRVRRKRGSHIGGSSEHRAFGAPMNRNCTLWTLRVER